MRFAWMDKDGTKHDVEIPRTAVMHLGDGETLGGVVLIGDADKDGTGDITFQFAGKVPPPIGVFFPEAHYPVAGGFKTRNIPVKQIIHAVLPVAVKAASIPLAAIPVIGPPAVQTLGAAEAAADGFLMVSSLRQSP